MNDTIDNGHEADTTVWAAFGDLMSVMLGIFVLILVAVIGTQLNLSSRLKLEAQQHQLETQRRIKLEQALAAPLAAGRVTLSNGRIGISGSFLFAQNSDQLQPAGRELLKSLAAPLTAYVKDQNQVLMVSGFTDDRQVRAGNRSFADNWELSAQRALTVTRAFIEEGVPAASLFAAAFGSEQPIGSNTDEAGRARNRRVEIAPVSRATDQAARP
jgi:flagellar motor protein MotB